MRQIEKHQADWDPFAISDTGDQRNVYDELRQRCPVAYSDRLQWSILRHDDVLRVITDHETFSNNVSRHLTVPNGMDPPEHTVYRPIVESYFSSARLRAFEPVCREIVDDLTGQVVAAAPVELIADFALDVSVRILCAFLGWPTRLHTPLAAWTIRSRDAMRAMDQPALAEIAREFQDLVAEMLAQRRTADALPEDDLTTSLMHETVYDRPLDEPEIASILRNWTVGEIGTMSASIGILVHHLAEHPDLQNRLRAEPDVLPYAIDEMLRIHGPLVTNRRIATRAVELGGRTIEAGERLSINWVAANRDERVFEHPGDFSFDRNPSKNLLYGAGIHVCPGAPLARMELLLVMESLLGKTTSIELDPDAPPLMAAYPASGYATLPVRMHQ